MTEGIVMKCVYDEVSELMDCVHVGWVMHDLDVHPIGSMQTTSGETILGMMHEIDRLQKVEQKAIALLRCHHGLDESYPTMNGCCERLREAIGITVEGLRGASSKS